jgi:hypothetical protein
VLIKTNSSRRLRKYFPNSCVPLMISSVVATRYLGANTVPIASQAAASTTSVGRVSPRTYIQSTMFKCARLFHALSSCIKCHNS